MIKPSVLCEAKAGLYSARGVLTKKRAAALRLSGPDRSIQFDACPMSLDLLVFLAQGLQVTASPSSAGVASPV